MSHAEAGLLRLRESYAEAAFAAEEAITIYQESITLEMLRDAFSMSIKICLDIFLKLISVSFEVVSNLLCRLCVGPER